MSANPIFSLHQGTAPLLVSMPHVGTLIPEALKPLYTARALGVEDTDWHMDTLYAFARDLGASLIVPKLSRYVIDLNRPPENTPMYAGANNTELCPTRHFSGDAIYQPGMAPGEPQIAQRVQTYWQPYHQALQAELARLRSLHGHVVLWDGHSIRSQLPWLFEGQLPDLNLGTVNGQSCAALLREALMQALGAQSHFSHVTDGRFKGGYITRQYGQPSQGVHAIQLEKCWSTYMVEAAPYALDTERAQRLVTVLQALLGTVLAWKPDH
jgi:N-formylglutamate deformylase